MAGGTWSVHLRYVADYPLYVGLPSLHAHNGKDGIDPVILLAVNRFYIEAVDFENAEDVSVLHHSLGNAVPVVPHVVGLFVQRESVESTEVHIESVALL